MRAKRLAVLPVAAATATVALVAAASTTSPAAAAAGHRTVGVIRGAHLGVNMSQSNNWSGYNQGVLETGKSYHSISGQWVVPTATAAQPNQDEASATWVGIGGGCLDTSCTLTDSTLIQAGTEQDVNADGSRTYDAWYELIPAPSLVTPLAVHPGDTVATSIVEGTPGVWTITMTNATTGQHWSTTVPYTSSYATAEWIEETPITVGSNGAGLAAMPNLGTVSFSNATANGVNAGLKPAEAVQLIDANGNPLATPSAPNATADGFNDCTYAATCAAP